MASPAVPAGLPLPAGAPVPSGVVLLHGFAGDPSSMAVLAEALRPLTGRVAVPVLRGHGGHWQDLRHVTWQDWVQDAGEAVRDLGRDGPVAVLGLSMGGALALHVAATHPTVSHVVLVNPSLTMRNPLLPLVPVLKYVRPSIANEARQVLDPDVDYQGYRRIPLSAVQQLSGLWKDMATRLPQVTQPLLVFRSLADGEAGERSVRLAMERTRPVLAHEVVLTRSGHVATLDREAHVIAETTAAFLRLSRPSQPVEEAGGAG